MVISVIACMWKVVNCFDRPESDQTLLIFFLGLALLLFTFTTRVSFSIEEVRACLWWERNYGLGPVVELQLNV